MIFFSSNQIYIEVTLKFLRLNVMSFTDRQRTCTCLYTIMYITLMKLEAY